MTQSLLVIAILVFAAGYIGLRFYRTARAARGSGGCGSGGCGCDPAE